MASNTYAFTDSAKQDLDEILNYISNVLYNQNAAIDFYNRLKEAIERIRDFPNLYPIVENEFITEKNIRKIIVKNYIVYYLYKEAEKTVVLLRIVYSKRNLEEVLRRI